MPEPCLLIDHAGRERPWPGRHGGAAFGYADPDFDFPGYAVRNLGYVLIAERASFMKIRMRPLVVCHRTLQALLGYVDRRQPARTAISYFDGTWHHELCGGAPAARRRILAIAETRRERPPQPFLRIRRDIAAMMHNRHDPFAPILRRWLDGTQLTALTAFLGSCNLYDRALLVERESDTGHFVFRHSGRGIQLYDPSWTEAAIGRKLQEQPDRAYGEWVADSCAAVDDCQVPRCELVTARVAHRGMPPRQWRYERLMLPWRTDGSRRFVVSVSLRDTGSAVQDHRRL